MSSDSTIFVLATVVLLPLLGGLLAAMPWLMRRSECFTVTIPESAQSDPDIVRLKRGYATWMVVLTVVLTALVSLLVASGSDGPAMLAFVASALVIPLASFLLMLRSRSRVQAVKGERGWRAERSRRSAVVAEGEMPRPVGLSWELLHVPATALALVVGLLGYASAPDRIPMHADFSGNVNAWADKSYASVLFPVVVQLFLAAAFVFSHWSIMRSKRVSDPDAPVSSAYAYGLFARAQSIFLVALGVALNLSMVCMELAMVGRMTIARAAMVIMVVTFAAIVGSVVLSAIYGQAGSRLMRRMASSDAMPVDDDEYWKLGVFYVNPDDQSLFVPDRFGVGWTSNFGRPASWAIAIGTVVVTIAFVLVAMAIA